MKRPHQAIIWSAKGHAWVPRVLSHHRTAALAERAVKRWLDRHPTVTTRDNYWRDVARADYGEVRNAKRPLLCGPPIEPRVLVVPSVGERGYW